MTMRMKGSQRPLISSKFMEAMPATIMISKKNPDMRLSR